MNPPAVASTGNRESLSEWTLSPRPSGLLSKIVEMWSYRHMFRYFSSLALQKLYYRTKLGMAWVFIRPLFPVLAGTLVFGSFIGVDTGEIPYFLFYLVGMSFWQLFSQSLMWATRSLELNRRVLRKIYFPRLMLPVAYVAPALSEFAILSVAVLWAGVYYLGAQGHFFLTIGSHFLLAVLTALLAVFLAVGIGFWTSVLGADKRDVRFTTQYVLNFWYFITPVIYPADFIPERWRWLVLANPMAPLVEAYKFAVLGMGTWPGFALGRSAIIIGIVFASGVWFFSRYESSALDRI